MMAKISETYRHVVVESYRHKSGGIHIRTIARQPYPQRLRVLGSPALGRDYPLGTRFRIKVKLTDREGRNDYLYTSWQWTFEVLQLGVTPRG